jgi:hypothetical protein
MPLIFTLYQCINSPAISSTSQTQSVTPAAITEVIESFYDPAKIIMRVVKSHGIAVVSQSS